MDSEYKFLHRISSCSGCAISNIPVALLFPRKTLPLSHARSHWIKKKNKQTNKKKTQAGMHAKNQKKKAGRQACTHTHTHTHTHTKGRHAYTPKKKQAGRKKKTKTGRQARTHKNEQSNNNNNKKTQARRHAHTHKKQSQRRHAHFKHTRCILVQCTYERNGYIGITRLLIFAKTN